MEPEDVIREVQKILDVLEVVDRHFTHEAEMNAALHMASVVRPAPLAAAVKTALGSGVALQERLRQVPGGGDDGQA